MSKSIKISRYEALICNLINRAILYEVNNKMVKLARVTYVNLTNDLSYATCYIDCLDRNKINNSVLALEKLSGFFRSIIAKHMQTYKTPTIKFAADKSIDYAKNIDIILKNIKEGKQ